MSSVNQAEATERSTMLDQAARFVSEVFNPPWVAIAVLGAVAWHSTDGTGEFVQWWAVSAFFSSLLPLGFLIQALRRGRVSDWYVTQAHERFAPFGVAAVSFGAAVLIMTIFSAPRELLAVTLAGMAGLLIALALIPKWKLSIHSGSIAGAVVVLILIFGPWITILVGVIPLAGWARVRVAHHTPSQVVAGGLIGAAVAAAVFSLVMAFDQG